MERSDQIGEKLLGLIADLNIDYEFEHSFKLFEKTLLANRFLLSINKNKIKRNPHGKILDICKGISMPETFLEAFKGTLFGANVVHFGFEENEKACVYEVHLDVGIKRERGTKTKLNKPDQHLSFLGFEWDPLDNTRCVLRRHTPHPFLSFEQMREKTLAVFEDDGRTKPWEIAKHFLDLVSSRVTHDKIIFLDVTEENSQRRSFDINAYKAELQLKEIYPLLLKIYQHYSIPADKFHELYNSVRTKRLGHLSGGIDREGRDFFAVYYGMEKIRKMGDVPCYSDRSRLFCFSFERKGNEFLYSCPSHVYDLKSVKRAILEVGKSAGIRYDVDSEDILRIRGEAEDDVDAVIQDLFVRINGYPRYFDYDYSSFANSEKPIVSCIILLTCNDVFVKDHLIPSIIKNSEGHPIEIIVVYNGFGCDLGAFQRFKVIESDFMWVSKAYNTGVEYARGDYIAIFHDDCILDDKQWIQKAIEALNNEVYAITGEFKNQTAKSTPLVMKKKVFLQLGGLDEFYFTGGEDRDFTYTIYLHGKKIVQNIDAVHLQGASTILMLTNDYEDFKRAISYNIIPLDVLKKLNEFYLNRASDKGLRVLMANYMLYFNDKFKRLVFDSEEQYISEKRRLTELVEQNKDCPLLNLNSNNALEFLEIIKT